MICHLICASKGWNGTIKNMSACYGNKVYANKSIKIIFNTTHRFKYTFIRCRLKIINGMMWENSYLRLKPKMKFFSKEINNQRHRAAHVTKYEPTSPQYITFYVNLVASCIFLHTLYIWKYKLHVHDAIFNPHW